MNLSCSLAYKIKMEKCHVVNVEHNAFVRQFREPERERERIVYCCRLNCPF